ncbi:MAG: DUF3455 domain-containing protein [Burkholderiales bacterium]|nr:DUF3455 domain-containing protein [Burkholderiales bacterium]
MKKTFNVLPLIATLATVSAFAQTPADITPPAGNKAAMTLVGVGTLAYECKAVADKPGTFAWTFAGPDAKLLDANKKEVGKYYAGPTWESTDGSKVTGKQLAVSPSAAGAIPLQLVQAAPATGKGAMTDVTYIQRLKTVGGVAPATPACAAANVGAKTTVGYSADYVFFKKG